jgi:hypothetical protein
MKRRMLLVLCLGCGGDAEPSQERECVTRPRVECAQPLPPTDRGQPWPTSSEATADVRCECTLSRLLERDDWQAFAVEQNCFQHEIECQSRREGTCSDGKTFASWSTSVTVDEYYFRDGVLVGVWSFGDVFFCEDGLTCGGGGFGDPSCEETSVEQFRCPCL